MGQFLPNSVRSDWVLLGWVEFVRIGSSLVEFSPAGVGSVGSDLVRCDWVKADRIRFD